MHAPHKLDQDHLAGLVYGPFVADALALGAHWIYDQDKVKQTVGEITDYAAPKSDSYHPRKEAGDQSHYGDQALVLLESLTSRKSFDFTDFATRWRSLWEGYQDYQDHATKDTLARLLAGLSPEKAGSDSEELGGAARLGPLLAWIWQVGEPLDAAIAVARLQTSLTHTSAIALDAAEFFTRVVYGVCEGAGVVAAVEKASGAYYHTLPANDMLSQARATLSQDFRAAAKHLGLACPASQAVPTTLALLLRHPDDLETAFRENVMAGGDSAARALVVGMVLGAQNGKSAMPERWIAELKNANQIEAFIATLPSDR